MASFNAQHTNATMCTAEARVRIPRATVNSVEMMNCRICIKSIVGIARLVVVSVVDGVVVLVKC